MLILNRDVFKKNYKKSLKKSLIGIPFFFTFLNAFFGFLSIIRSLEGDYSLAAGFIFLAAAMDACDGRVARALNASSDLGMELDSLCDAISFCLAPIVLLYCWYPETLNFFDLLILGFYVCAGLFRLARFNLTSCKQQHAFIGLPTPLAAFFIAGLVLQVKFVLYKQLLHSLVLFVGLLMISPVRFPTFKYCKGAPLKKIIVSIFIICLLVAKNYSVLFIGIIAYILYGLINSFFLFFRKDF